MAKLLFRVLVMAVMAGAMSISARANGIEYTITDLGNNIYPTAISAAGHITGSDNNTGQAFIYNGTTVRDIGVIGQGNAINSSDQVAGNYYDPTTQQDYPFVYNVANGATLLGGYSGQANGINSSGEVVGQINTPGGQEAFLYSGGSITYLASLGPGAMAYGVNDSGQITGYAQFFGPDSEDAYIYNSDGVVEDLGLSTPDGALGVTPIRANFGIAINDAGQVAIGAFQGLGSALQAFLWNGATMSNLGPIENLSSWYAEPEGINDSGQIVGWGNSLSTIGNTAFIYSNGAMANLNLLIDPASALTLIEANGINNAGQIIALAENASGQEEGVLLSPVVPLPAALPAGLVLLGLIAVVGRRHLML